MKSLYLIQTGELTGLQIDDVEIIAANTPAGYAWVEGVFDARLYTVQTAAGDAGPQLPKAVRRTPPRPADSVYLTWAWSDAAGDWVSTETLAMAKERAQQPLLALLKALDEPVTRAAGEITQAIALGQTAPAAAVTRLQAVNADKALVRARVAAIAAAATPEALQALLAQPLTLQTTLA